MSKDTTTTSHNHHSLSWSTLRGSQETGDTEDTMRPMLRTSIRVIDLLAALLWVVCLVMLVVATLTVTTDSGSPEIVDLLIIWSLFLGKLALGATILSVATWVVRQFEEAFRISENVHEINNELSEMRARRHSAVPRQPHQL